MDDCSGSPSFADEVPLIIFQGLSFFFSPFNNNNLSLISRELNHRSCKRLGDERGRLKRRSQPPAAAAASNLLGDL